MLNQKLCSIIFTLSLLISLTSTAFAANLTSHDLSNGYITLTAKHGDVIISGSYDGYGAAIRVKDGYNGTITLDNATINAKRQKLTPDEYRQSNSGSLDGFSATYSAINIEYETNVVINVVGDNKITGEHIGIYSISEEDLLLTGEGTLEIETSSSCGIIATKLIIDTETISSGIEASNLIINKNTFSKGHLGIESGSLIINAETTAISNGKDTAGIWANNITINAKTKAKGNNGDGIHADNCITINAPTYAEGRNGITADSYVSGFGSIIIKADTTAIGTNGYGVYSNTNITVDNATLTATGSSRGVKIGQGYKNVTIGTGKIIS